MINSTQYPIYAGIHIATICNPRIEYANNVNNPRRPTDRIRALAMNFQLELLDESRQPTGLFVSGGVSLASRHGHQAPIIRLADAVGCFIDPDCFEDSIFENAIVKVEIELHLQPHLGLMAVPVKYFNA
ncbi:hypothetical protein P4B35_22665 [Pontiellaceae bacterium B12227]|nr:hypothetical protein [Pontiellaceae bacterium B12227]